MSVFKLVYGKTNCCTLLGNRVESVERKILFLILYIELISRTHMMRIRKNKKLILYLFRNDCFYGKSAQKKQQ